jgi:hypothetical protein
MRVNTIEVTPAVCETVVSGASRSASWVVEIASISSSRTIGSSYLTSKNEKQYMTHRELVREHIEPLCRYHVDEQ